MDFTFDLNQLFPTGPATSRGVVDIVRIGPDLLPVDLVRSTVHFRNLGFLQQKVSEVVDRMGQLSAEAQGLKMAITSGEKIRNHPEHSVYLLLDRESHGGSGSVVGLLKVGRKNLFLLDRAGDQNEVCPMCVLDFYVHESRQRSGCGRRIFEHMLADQKMSHPRFMAVDRPSPKLLGFLRKYYELTEVIPQVNNYVIFDGFFSSANNNLTADGSECGGENGTGNGGATVKRPRIYMGRLQYV